MGHTPIMYSVRVPRDSLSLSGPPSPQDPVLPPACRLPTELLIIIFLYCAAEEDLAPVTLRRVSRWWRDVVDASPQIWQVIYLDDKDRSVASSRHQAELWMERSKPLTYDIEVNADNPDMILPLLSPLLPSIDRWRKFVLTGKRQERMTMIPGRITPDMLDHLNIALYHYDEDFDEPEGLSSKVTFAPTYEGWQDSFAMYIWVAKLPAPDLLAPLHFAHLTISEGPIGDLRTCPFAILELLSACIYLESFSFSGWTHDDDPPKGSHPLVSLPHLHTLHLKGTCSARALLSSVHVPRLQNLYLTHLNVDFPLPGEHHDAGDSEDEARDFSQSPWSDHATGMGLRKLIARSNPPIRILEMDFSDMRTKDFKFVFDHLPQLTEFRIVASDMSDKVINFLLPTQASEGGGMKVRLPKLRDLDLLNCNRLTGDTILEVLKARVAYTDIVTPENTLQEVGIVGCASFTPRHEQLLFREIGSRLRTEEP